MHRDLYPADYKKSLLDVGEVCVDKLVLVDIFLTNLFLFFRSVPIIIEDGFPAILTTR